VVHKLVVLILWSLDLYRENWGGRRLRMVRM